MVFENALQAEVLKDSPVVHGPAAVRFYAGAPLRTREGYLIGTICLVDQQPRSFSENDRKVLERMAKVIMEQLELRLKALKEVEAEQQLAQEKQEFISIASHELRTPVTSLTAAIQLMQRVRIEAPPAFTNLLEQAAKSLAKLNKLISDLLDVNRAEIGHLQLNKTTFTISELINDCCTHIRHGGSHHIHLSGELELEVCADEHKIDQVIVNLANNVVKYAPEAPDIHMNVSRAGDFAKISVKDNGPGIPLDKQQHLFERYYRVGNSKRSGLGLGLYISAQIIRQHGGEIGVDSAPGKGSIFWFTLPLEKE